VVWISHYMTKFLILSHVTVRCDTPLMWLLSKFPPRPRPPKRHVFFMRFIKKGSSEIIQNIIRNYEMGILHQLINYLFHWFSFVLFNDHVYDGWQLLNVFFKTRNFTTIRDRTLWRKYKTEPDKNTLINLVAPPPPPRNSLYWVADENVLGEISHNNNFTY
jgi:hypothetical protein